MAGPLDGIRVLDATWVLSGPFATMVLADLGAEVLKVEKPGQGDLARGTGPFQDGVSAYFQSINRGKKSLTLDLATAEGRGLFLALAEKVDVLVENLVPGSMEKLGLSYDLVKERNPALVYASISGFGQTGPYAHKPALDVVVQGMGGIMSITGEPGGPPVRPGVSLGDIAASLFTVAGILSALEERRRTGLGQQVDISMLDCQIALQENAFARYFATGEVPEPMGTRHPSSTPFQAFKAQDGYFVVATFGGTGNQWPLFCSVIGRLDLIDDPRFETAWSRTVHYEELIPQIAPIFETRPVAHWLRELDAVGLPCGPVNNIARAAQDPQVLSRGMLVSVPHPALGQVKLVNTPVKLSRTPGGVRRCAPELGEHTEEVLQGLLGLSAADIQRLREKQVV